MADAVRKVTIIVDVKPGEIIKPDVSWIADASTGMKELVTEQNSVSEMVKKTREESEALVKTQVEAIKIEKELSDQKAASANETQKQVTEEAAAQKKKIEEKKVIEEDYHTWAARRQAEWAENQRKIDEEAAKRRAEAIKQTQDANAEAGDGTRPAFVPPTPNPRLPLRDPDAPSSSRADFRDQQIQAQIERQERAEAIARQRRNQEHQRELAEIDRLNQEEAEKLRAEEEKAQERKVEMAQRTLQKIRVFELASVRERLQEAEDTFDKIKKAELKHAKERREGAEKAEEDMPKHWRNVGLNAGQAVASVARYIGHMRMLKNVGGDALESIAKEFMTVQSRVETVAASTSAFTNFGTMIDGLQKAAKETEKIVVMQQMLGQATSITQNMTMSLGRAASTIMPMIAPMQFTFTAITAAVVAADIAMDFFNESTEDAEQKTREMLAGFNEGLDKVNEKLRIERDLLSSQSGILQAQWDIKRLMAGDDGLSPEEQARNQEQMRQRQDSDAQRALRDSAGAVFEASIPDNIKAAIQETKEEAKRIADERAAAKAEIEFYSKRIKDMPEGSPLAVSGAAKSLAAASRLNQLDEDERANNRRKGMADLDTAADTSELLKSIKVKDGVVQNLDEVIRHFQFLPPAMEDAGNKYLQELSKQLTEGTGLITQQASDARQKSKSAEIEKKQQETVLKDLVAGKEDEAAVAERFKLRDSKFATDQVDMYLKQMEDPNATLDDKQMSVSNIKDVLGKADLVTPDLSRILERGGSASPGDIRAALGDAQEFTRAEQRDVDALISKADAAIKKAETDAADMAVIADRLTRMLEVNSKQLNDLQRAIDSRDGI